MGMSTLIPPGLLARLGEVPSVGVLRDFVSTVGGFSNLSFAATTEHGVRVVVKATASDRKRADLRREQVMLKHLEELKSDGVETVRYDIDHLILFLTHIHMKEHGWISLPSSKYLN